MVKLEGVLCIISFRHTLGVCKYVRKKHVHIQAWDAGVQLFQPIEKGTVCTEERKPVEASLDRDMGVGWSGRYIRVCEVVGSLWV